MVKLELNPVKKYRNVSAYKLKDPTRVRHKALTEKIEKSGKTKGVAKAALAKKRRLGVLRVYRKYKRVRECKIITKDMRYINKKYLPKNAKTKQICGKSFSNQFDTQG